MSNQFHTGDKVDWNSHGTTVTGTIEEKITSDTKSPGAPCARRRTNRSIASAATSADATTCTSPNPYADRTDTMADDE